MSLPVHRRARGAHAGGAHAGIVLKALESATDAAHIDFLSRKPVGSLAAVLLRWRGTTEGFEAGEAGGGGPGGAAGAAGRVKETPWPGINGPLQPDFGGDRQAKGRAVAAFDWSRAACEPDRAAFEPARGAFELARAGARRHTKAAAMQGHPSLCRVTLPPAGGH